MLDSEKNLLVDAGAKLNEYLCQIPSHQILFNVREFAKNISTTTSNDIKIEHTQDILVYM